MNNTIKKIIALILIVVPFIVLFFTDIINSDFMNVHEDLVYGIMGVSFFGGFALLAYTEKEHAMSDSFRVIVSKLFTVLYIIIAIVGIFFMYYLFKFLFWLFTGAG